VQSVPSPASILDYVFLENPALFMPGRGINGAVLLQATNGGLGHEDRMMGVVVYIQPLSAEAE
jgi:hypothetical protein